MSHSDPSLERLYCLQADLDSIYQGDGKLKWSLLSFSTHLALESSRADSTLDPKLVKRNAHTTTEIISHLFDYLAGWELLAWNAKNTSNPTREAQLSRLLARAAFIRFCSLLDAFARLVLAHSGKGYESDDYAPSFSRLLDREKPHKLRQKLTESPKDVVDRLQCPAESIVSIRNALIHRVVYLQVTQSSDSLLVWLNGSQWREMETQIFKLRPEVEALEFDLYQSWVLSEFLVAAESFITAESERLGLDIEDRPKGGPLKVSLPVRDHLESLIERAISE